MLFGNPVRGRIYTSPGLISGSPRWFRSQRFGCTGFSAERPLGNCSHFHRGIDVARGPAGCGDDLLATAAGTIHFAGGLPAGAPSYSAIVVEINHGGGIFTVHTHLQNEIVSVGQKVSKGQKIGEVGATGNATGCHDHYALKYGASANGGSILGDDNGRWVDPWPRLEQNVLVRPKAGDGIRIRSQLSLGDSHIYATVDGDRIIRKSDGKDLGSQSTWRRWFGVRTGPAYNVSGSTSVRWEEMALDGKHVFVASLLAQRSMS